MFGSIEIVMSDCSGPVEEIVMKRFLWLLAAGSMNTVLLHPQETGAPSEVPPAVETAEAVSETASDEPDMIDEPSSSEVAAVPAESPSTSRSVEAEDVTASAAAAPVRSAEASVKPADQPPYDPTDNAQWESRYVGDRVPAASKPAGYRPYDRAAGWFREVASGFGKGDRLFGSGLRKCAGEGLYCDRAGAAVPRKMPSDVRHTVNFLRGFVRAGREAQPTVIHVVAELRRTSTSQSHRTEIPRQLRR